VASLEVAETWIDLSNAVLAFAGRDENSFLKKTLNRMESRWKGFDSPKSRSAFGRLLRALEPVQ
jgi:hypothetical protein